MRSGQSERTWTAVTAQWNMDLYKGVTQLQLPPHSFLQFLSIGCSCCVCWSQHTIQNSFIVLEYTKLLSASHNKSALAGKNNCEWGLPRVCELSTGRLNIIGETLHMGSRLEDINGSGYLHSSVGILKFRYSRHIRTARTPLFVTDN